MPMGGGAVNARVVDTGTSFLPRVQNTQGLRTSKVGVLFLSLRSNSFK